MDSEGKAAHTCVWGGVEEVVLRAAGFQEVRINSVEFKDGRVDLGVIRFEPVKTATIRVVDSKGIPLKGVTANILAMGTRRCFGYRAGLYLWFYDNGMSVSDSRFGTLVDGLWRRDVMDEGESLQTDAEGLITLPFPPNGKISLSIHLRGYVPQLLEFVAYEFSDGPQEVALEDGGRVEGTLPTLAGVPSEKIEIFLVKDGEDLSDLGATARQGLHISSPYLLLPKQGWNFEMRDIPPGKWIPYVLMGPKMIRGEDVEVRCGESSQIIFPQKEEVFLRGRILVPDGQSAAGARVWIGVQAFALSIPPEATRCDALGHFEISVIPEAGQYLLSEFDRGANPQSTTIRVFLPQDLAKEREIPSLVGKGMVLLDYSDYVIRKITGRVYLNGKPLVGHISPNDYSWGSDIEEDGAFSVEYYSRDCITLVFQPESEAVRLRAEIEFDGKLALTDVKIEFFAPPVTLVLSADPQNYKFMFGEIHDLASDQVVVGFVAVDSDGKLDVSMLPDGRYRLKLELRSEVRPFDFTIGEGSDTHHFKWKK